MSESCETCKFSRLAGPSHHQPDQLQCRKNVPANCYPMFPDVAAECWCGEYQRIIPDPADIGKPQPPHPMEGTEFT